MDGNGVHHNFSSFHHPLVSDEDNIPDNDSYKCTVLKSNRSILILNGQFEGVPDNIMINVVVWAVLLIIFTFLRKRAWDYGRIALVQKNDQRWTQLFYGEGTASSHRINTEDRPVDSEDGPVDSEDRPVDSEDSPVDSDEIAFMDKGIFSWLKAIVLLRDHHILKRNGPDAIQYLSFQRYIILYLLFISVICVFVILPINYLLGDLVDDDNKFGKTTLSNLDPGSPCLWIHVVCSFFFILYGIVVMRCFSANLKWNENESLVKRTLLIFNVPIDQCDESTVTQEFQKAYPECLIEQTQLAYDVRNITKLEAKRETSTHARLYCENVLKETGIRPRMRPYACGHICICCICRKTVDAIDYYTEEEHALATAADRQRSVTLLMPVGIAFLILQTEEMAERIFKDNQKRWKCPCPPCARFFNQKLPSICTVDFAPAPEDIIWENLSVSTSLWYTRAFSTNAALFFLFFFLTTPTVVISYLDVLYPPAVKKFVRETPVVKDFFSTLLLLLFSSLLPVVVSYTDRFMPHWTRSNRNHSKMVRVFIFLLFMVVILPLLQLTSVKGFLEWTIRTEETYRWKCVFLSGNGAFFVNYVITATFIGTALDLIRFPELFTYLFYIWFSRSSRAEQTGLRKAILWEFEFGVQYAYILLIFSVVVIYSVLCPLIAPCGALYMVFKHLIDRYNIYYVYGPSKISRFIHATAINFVSISFILMQMCIFFFLYLRNGWMALSVVSMTIFLMTCVIFLAQVFFQWFQWLSPISYKAFASENNEIPRCTLDLSQQPYLPSILKRSSSQGEIFTTSIQERSYGTNEDSVQSTPDRGSINLPCAETDPIAINDELYEYL